MVLLTLGLLSAAAIVTLSIYWKNIVQWIKRVWQKLIERLPNDLIQGVKTFIVKTQEGYKNCTRYYSQDRVSGEWQETNVMKMVDESEIPRSILQKIKGYSVGSELETTEQLLSMLS